MDLRAPIDRLLTIHARQIKTAGATLPGVIVPSHKYLWYYVASWPDGSLAASLHLGEGVVPAGETQPWRVMRRDRSRLLLRPTLPTYPAVTSRRITISGLDRLFFVSVLETAVVSCVRVSCELMLNRRRKKKDKKKKIKKAALKKRDPR